MSHVPLPAVLCGPLKPRKYPPDVTGTCNVAYGHRLKERSNCRVGGHSKRSLLLEKADQDAREMRELEQIAKSQDFVKQTDQRIRKHSVWQRVQQGIAAHEENVAERREKLRGLILREEEALTQAVVDQAQQGDDFRAEDMRRKTEELRKQEETKRQALVAAKRMQQYLAQCPEIREKLIKRRTIESKLCNLAQIAEHAAEKEAEKELDTLWHELMLKEVEAKKQREIAESEVREREKRATISTLAKQVAGKLALEEEQRRVQREEREYLERLWERVRQEELKNLERQRLNREKLKRDLEEQIVTAKRYLAERAREEAAMDRMLNTLVDEEIAKERTRIGESSASLRREILAYLAYLEDLRRDQAKRELEVEAIIEQSNKDALVRRDLAMRKFKEARERLLREVLRGREEQIRRKLEDEAHCAERARAEKELQEKQLELDAKLTAQQREEARIRAIRYGRELKEQQRRVEDMRRREAERSLNIDQTDTMRDEEYQRLTRELLEASENVTPHPFKALLKECAARRAAEKEGLCYCPPPLSAE